MWKKTVVMKLLLLKEPLRPRETRNWLNQLERTFLLRAFGTPSFADTQQSPFGISSELRPLVFRRVPVPEPP